MLVMWFMFKTIFDKKRHAKEAARAINRDEPASKVIVLSKVNPKFGVRLYSVCHQEDYNNDKKRDGWFLAT